MKVHSIFADIIAFMWYLLFITCLLMYLKMIEQYLFPVLVLFGLFTMIVAFQTEQRKNGWLSVLGFCMYCLSWLIADKVNIWFGEVVCVAGIVAIFIATLETWITPLIRMSNKKMEI